MRGIEAPDWIGDYDEFCGRPAGSALISHALCRPCNIRSMLFSVSFFLISSRPFAEC